MHVGATATRMALLLMLDRYPPLIPLVFYAGGDGGGCVVCHFNHLGQHTLLPAMWQPVVAL